MKYNFVAGRTYKMKTKNCQGANNTEGEIVTAKNNYRGNDSEAVILVRNSTGRDWSFKAYNLLDYNVTVTDLEHDKQTLQEEIAILSEKIEFMKAMKLKELDQTNFAAWRALKIASNKNYTEEQKINELKRFFESTV